MFNVFRKLTSFKTLEDASERLDVDHWHAEADKFAEPLVLNCVREIDLHVLLRVSHSILRLKVYFEVESSAQLIL